MSTYGVTTEEGIIGIIRENKGVFEYTTDNGATWKSIKSGDSASLATISILFGQLYYEITTSIPKVEKNKLIIPAGIVKTTHHGGVFTIIPNEIVFDLNETETIDDQPNYRLNYDMPFEVQLVHQKSPGANSKCLWDINITGTAPNKTATIIPRYPATTTFNSVLYPVGTQEWFDTLFLKVTRSDETVKWFNSFFVNATQPTGPQSGSFLNELKVPNAHQVYREIERWLRTAVFSPDNPMWLNPEFQRITPSVDSLGRDENNMVLTNVQFVRGITRSLPKKTVGILPIGGRRVLVDHFALKVELEIVNATRKRIYFEPRSEFDQEWTTVIISGTSQGFNAASPEKVTIPAGTTHQFIMDHTVARIIIFADNRDNGWGKLDTKMVDIATNGNATTIFYDATIIEQ